jgi:hypothetical protein
MQVPYEAAAPVLFPSEESPPPAPPEPIPCPMGMTFSLIQESSDLCVDGDGRVLRA